MQKQEDRKKVERPDLDWGLRHEGCRAPRHIFQASRYPGTWPADPQVPRPPGPQAPQTMQAESHGDGVSYLLPVSSSFAPLDITSLSNGTLCP